MINRAPRRPGCQLIHSPRKCLYNNTTTFIFPKKQIGKTNSHCWYRTLERFFHDVCRDLQMLWPVKSISYKLQARCHSSPCSQVCKMVPDDFVKMTPWIIKINFASNKLLSKSLRWALGWTEICYHTRKYHLQMWYLHIVLETFLKQFSNKCNIIHSIIIKLFKCAHLFFNFLFKKKPDICIIWLQMWKKCSSLSKGTQI